MVQVLIINFYENSNNGNKSFSRFKTTIEKIVKERCDGRIAGQCNFICKRQDELADFILDWEHDYLDEKAKQKCRIFDRLDMIFIAGDMKILPWEPIATQLITLIHMANRTQKPVFSCGSGAYASIYTTCTRGNRFYVLNGPMGNSIEELPKFPHFSPGSGAYPSGWLDADTGDIYTYDTTSRKWIPTCNVGMFRIPSHGAPSTARLRVEKKFGRDDHLLAPSQNPTAVEENEQTAVIRNKHLNHVLLSNLPSQAFVSTMLPNWYIHGDGALPSGSGLYTMADSHKGSVLLAQDNKLLFASDITQNNSFSIAATIMKNYVNHIINCITNKERIDILLFEYLFGDGEKGGSYDTTHVEPMLRALASKPVKTRIRKEDGPVKVETPLISMFFKDKISLEKVDYHALTAPVIKTTIGKRTVNVVREPFMSRNTRMDRLLQQVGHHDAATLDVCAQAHAEASQDDELSLDEKKVIEDIKDRFAGMIMNTTNIKDRKKVVIDHHIQKPEDRRASTRQSTRQSSRGYTKSDNNGRPLSGVARVRIAENIVTNSENPTKVVPLDFSKLQADEPNNQNSRRILTTRKIASEVAEKKKDLLLPHCRPNSSRSNTHDEIVFLTPKDNKPLCNFQKFEEMTYFEDNEEYKGVYTSVFRTPLEKELHDNHISKQKNVSNNPFKSFFGKASEIKLRQEGLIRGAGLYPEAPGFGFPIMQAKDFAMCRNEDKSKRVAGAWVK